MATKKKKKSQSKVIKKLISDAAKAVESIPEDELEMGAKKSDIPADGKCFNCSKKLESPDYCFGCQTFVCETCDKNFELPIGPHTAGDHLEDPEQDD